MDWPFFLKATSPQLGYKSSSCVGSHGHLKNSPKSLKMCVCVNYSVVSDSVTPWTVACQPPLSTGFSRQEYWLPFASPGDLPDPGTESRSPALQADSSETPGKPL